MSDRARRLARNEALFRSFNEGIERASGAFQREHERSFGRGLPAELEIVCECGAGDCEERIAIRTTRYERVRADPTRFVVRPGHEIPDVETVVEPGETYNVIEKREGEPADLARTSDPRRPTP